MKIVLSQYPFNGIIIGLLYKNTFMADVKNLSNTNGVDKLKELAKDADICMFITDLTSLPLTARPMSTAGVDDEGNLWFFSQLGSEKNIDITRDNRVQLFYTNKSSSEFLSVFGFAEIVHNRNKIEEFWTTDAKAWFKEGKDDPLVTIIKVVPSDAYYWETKNGKMISLVKKAIAAVTGKPMDVGIEGEIKI